MLKNSIPIPHICPNCNLQITTVEDLNKFFGFRKMNNKQVRVQSHCKTCRSKNRTKVVSPFKFLGSKARLFPDIVNNIPENFNTYYEPFVGGGSVFFNLKPQKAVLSDINEELIIAYKAIRDNVEVLIKSLKKHVNDEDYFYKIRSLDRHKNFYYMSKITRASRFIYLNKTAFGGMWRVNKKNYNNVPFGKYTNPKICNENVLRKASESLKDVRLLHCSFLDTFELLKPNDFVYLDPPYMKINKTSFTTYSHKAFPLFFQEELKEWCDRLTKNNIKFLLSNSDSNIIKQMYSNYNITKVQLHHMINIHSKNKDKVTELLIKNY